MLDDYEITESICNAIRGIDMPEPADLSEIENKLDDVIDALNNLRESIDNGVTLVIDAINGKKGDE